MTEDGGAAWQVQDGKRTITFDGILIGSATSDDGHRDHWVDIAIYRTDAGSYVVSFIGRTRLAHIGEVDRPKAQVSTTPEGAVESLYLVDDDGVRYMTYVAKRAAEEAAENDPEFRSAYLVEHVA
jgi:hypothetical protein